VTIKVEGDAAVIYINDRPPQKLSIDSKYNQGQLGFLVLPDGEVQLSEIYLTLH
jgi:hypothetical protein